MLPANGEAGWGTKLNNAFGSVDTDVTAVKTTADASLPKAGGALTGRLDAQTVTMVTDSVAPVISGGVATATFDLSKKQFFTTTVNGPTTFVFDKLNVAASGLAQGFIIAITSVTASAITFPSGVRWPQNLTPTFTSGAGKCDLIAFITETQGSLILASVIGQNYTIIP